MKKIKLFCIVLGITACKKDRVCTCVVDTPSGTYITKTTMYDVKKREARQNCIGTQTQVITATGTTVGNKTTCKLQ